MVYYEISVRYHSMTLVYYGYRGLLWYVSLCSQYTMVWHTNYHGKEVYYGKSMVNHSMLW